jgi:hypothetical protein
LLQVIRAVYMCIAAHKLQLRACALGVIRAPYRAVCAVACWYGFGTYRAYTASDSIPVGDAVYSLYEPRTPLYVVGVSRPAFGAPVLTLSGAEDVHVPADACMQEYTYFDGTPCGKFVYTERSSVFGVA